MTLAPIILFVYNRPDHTARTLQALQHNPEAHLSDLYVYADGPKTTSDAEKVAQVRKLFVDLTGFRSIHVSTSNSNRGLANSIIRGVTEVIDKHEKAIVLEDDIVVSSIFLQFMNQALMKYAEDTRVAAIHGWNFPLRAKNLPDSFFLRGADCWGWATWERAWKLFEPDGKKLLKQMEEQNLSKQFDLEGAYPYTQMLRDQIAGKNNSWAIRWHASIFLQNGLTLHPGKSLVENIGLDGTGVHSVPAKAYETTVSRSKKLNFPYEVAENRQMRDQIIEYIWHSNRMSLLKRLKVRTKELLSKAKNYLSPTRSR